MRRIAVLFVERLRRTEMTWDAYPVAVRRTRIACAGLTYSRFRVGSTVTNGEQTRDHPIPPTCPFSGVFFRSGRRSGRGLGRRVPCAGRVASNSASAEAGRPMPFIAGCGRRRHPPADAAAWVMQVISIKIQRCWAATVRPGSDWHISRDLQNAARALALGGGFAVVYDVVIVRSCRGRPLYRRRFGP